MNVLQIQILERINSFSCKIKFIQNRVDDPECKQTINAFRAAYVISACLKGKVIQTKAVTVKVIIVS